MEKEIEKGLEEIRVLAGGLKDCGKTLSTAAFNELAWNPDKTVGEHNIELMKTMVRLANSYLNEIKRILGYLSLQGEKTITTDLPIGKEVKK
jgi:hypothetical protein